MWGGQVTTEKYGIVAGDCLSLLGAIRNFDPEVVWKQQPAAIQNMFTSPNHLTAGKVILLPKEEKTIKGKPTGAAHNFTITTRKVKLRSLVLGADDKPITGSKYKLEYMNLSGHRTTSALAPIPASGIIENEILAVLGKATLTIEYAPPVKAAPAAKPAPPKPAPATPPYPPEVTESHFTDVNETAYIHDGKPILLEWTLAIGFLPSHLDDSGVMARLENLGFDCADGLDLAARRMQRWYKVDPVTGYPAADKAAKAKFQNALKAKHDDP